MRGLVRVFARRDAGGYCWQTGTRAGEGGGEGGSGEGGGAAGDEVGGLGEGGEVEGVGDFAGGGGGDGGGGEAGLGGYINDMAMLTGVENRWGN